MFSNKCYFYFLFFLVVYSFNVFADVVKLKGGGKFQGEVTYADDEKLEIKVKTGIVAIQINRVLSIESSELIEIENLLSDAQRETRPEEALEICRIANDKLQTFKKVYPLSTAGIVEDVEKLMIKGRSIIAQIKERIKSKNLVLYHGKYISGDLKDLIVNEEKERAEKKKRKTVAVKYFEEANRFAKQKKYEQAIEKFKKAVEEMPDVVGPHYNLANLYEIQQDYGNALEEYQKVVAMEPAALDAYVALGEIYRKMGKIEKGISILKRAVEIIPNNVEARYNLAMFYLNISDYNNAILQCIEIVALDPDYTPASILLGRIYFQQKAYDKAAEAYERVIDKNPDSEEVHHLLGTLYRAQEKYTKAIEEYKKALEINPANSDARNSIEDLKILEKITRITKD
ncbi:MAG: tetratricopeptide repeat protein [Candidatus Aureabacteria bacterium]|nr:tetratricopeptide repeat protein [Candidatus Auribacterota bacterium]